MDSSQNWLAFSLSNHQSSSPSSSNVPLSLFEPFPNPSHHSQTDSLSSLSCAFDENSLNLSMFPLGPKLEDFLGGSNAMTVSQFSGENQHQTADNTTLYGTGTETGTGADSELKNIAASFLRGYSSSMNDQTLTTIEPESIASASASAASTALAVVPVVESSTKKAVDTFGQRTSIYRGVTRHRWTGRYEAHLWDNSCRREGQSRKGRQVYLGGYDKEDKAARAYDLAALKYWGPTTTTNFPVTNYEKELEEMQNMSRQEFVASLRRKSSGFSRGASIYRGVTRHHQHGRWQARIGRVAGNKDLYLGTFSTQEEAAEAYDIAAIKFRGLNAVTNFDMSRYDVKSIASSNLPIGGVSGKAKATSESHSDNRSSDGSRSDERDLSSVTSVSFASQPSSSSTTLNFAMPIKQDPSDQYWPLHSYQNNYQTVGTTTNAYAAYHGLTGLNMDFNVGTNGYVQVQQQGGANTIPFGTPMNLLQQQHQQQSNSYESSGGSGASYGNWGVTPSGHVFQTGKPNISVYQTPIYGME